MKRVLIVAASPINRIVIARTIERIYLRPRAVAPDAALQALRDHHPRMVIIDGNMEAALLEALLAELARRREDSEEAVPRTILIAEPSRQRDTPWPPIDAVVAKPITPDILQPVVERLLGQRGA